MKTFFAWKTIEESFFEKEISYSYGSPVTAGDLALWNSTYEALEVRVTIRPQATMPDIRNYIHPDEQAELILRWTGDNKFSGCGKSVPFDFPNPSTTQCNIPRGSCSTHLSLECDLIVRPASGVSPDTWARPPGSIIGTIPIVENIPIGKGNVFPLWEYDGDGKHLIKWDFSSDEDLETSLMSALMVIVDRAHPLINKAEYATNKPFVNLMIIQQFARKAFSPGIFEQLVGKQETNEAWMPDSLGASFDTLLKKMCTVLNVRSFQGLKAIYSEYPEKIDCSIDTIFSLALKL